MQYVLKNFKKYVYHFCYTQSYYALRRIKVNHKSEKMQVECKMSKQRRSHSTQLNCKPIEFSKICYDSACITLNLPLSLNGYPY